MKRTILALIAAAALLLPTAAFAQNVGTIFSGNGNRYLVVEQSMTWDEARTYAEQCGGYLATITSAAENAFITDLIQRNVTRGAFWIGGQLSHYTGRQGTIIDQSWVTGEDFTYTNWAPGRPMNPPQQKTVILRVPRIQNSQSGHWVDVQNPGFVSGGTTEIGLIIEWSSGTAVYSATPLPFANYFGSWDYQGMGGFSLSANSYSTYSMEGSRATKIISWNAITNPDPETRAEFPTGYEVTTETGSTRQYFFLSNDGRRIAGGRMVNGVLRVDRDSVHSR